MKLCLLIACVIDSQYEDYQKEIICNVPLSGTQKLQIFQLAEFVIIGHLRAMVILQLDSKSF